MDKLCPLPGILFNACREREREKERNVAKWPPLNKLSTLYIRMESISSCLPKFHWRGDSSPSRRTISYRSSRNSALRIRLAFRNTGRVDRSESVKLWERSICLSDKRKKKKEKEERLMGYINSKGKKIYIYIPPIGNFSIVEGTIISKIAPTLNFLFREINLRILPLPIDLNFKYIYIYVWKIV